MKTSRSSARLVVVGLAAAAALPLLSDTVSAADHLDAPKTMMNQAADITDVYAWHTDDAKVVAVVNFSGLIESGVDGGVERAGDRRRAARVWAMR